MIKEAIFSYGAAIAPNNQICIVGYNLNYRAEALAQFADTFLVKNPGYQVDSSFMDLRDDELTIKRFLLKGSPKEVYEVRFDGNMCIRSVYNADTDKWLVLHAQDEDIPDKESDRIQKRFQSQVLNAIISEVNRSSLPDTLKYIN